MWNLEVEKVAVITLMSHVWFILTLTNILNLQKFTGP